MRTIALLVSIVLAMPLAHAEKVEAAMLCGVFKKKEVDYLVPTDDGRKLTKPIDCAIEMKRAPKGALMGAVWIKTGDHESEHRSDSINKGDDFEVQLKPGTDFDPCTNFEIHAEISGPSGPVWQDTQKVTQACAGAGAATANAAPAAAKKSKIKAKLDCSIELAGNKWQKLGAPGLRIDGTNLACSLNSKDSALLGGRAFIKTVWHKGTILQNGGERAGDPVAEGDEYTYTFGLQKGADWDTCATDVTINATVLDPNGQVVYETKKLLTQNCAAAAPAKAAAASAKWDDGALKQIPEAARAIAQQFIDAVVDSDPPTLGTLAGAGVKRGKKVLVAKDVYDLTPYNIKPVKECDEAGKNCKFGPWIVINKNASEFWVYSANDSGYGTFGCAVFTKSKTGDWGWSAIKSYDTGEP